MTKGQDSDLPLNIFAKRHDAVVPARFKFRARYFLVLLVPLFMFSGAVIGMYFQPPALQKFYALTGLKPGGGSATPIALPPEVVLPKDMAETMRVSDVVGLARLMPLGDISIVAPPYGAGDARVSEILVAEGDVVAKGALLARLDNDAQLKGNVFLAEANLAVRQATLAQTRATVENSRNEAQASLEQARSVAAKAAVDLSRAKQLAKGGLRPHLKRPERLSNRPSHWLPRPRPLWLVLQQSKSMSSPMSSLPSAILRPQRPNLRERAMTWFAPQSCRRSPERF
jgi:HlyD family secretion protein